MNLLKLYKNLSVSGDIKNVSYLATKTSVFLTDADARLWGDRICLMGSSFLGFRGHLDHITEYDVTEGCIAGISTKLQADACVCCKLSSKHRAVF